MTKKKPTLGAGAEIDVNRLLVTRLLLQANSGGGKSWAIRRLLEQTHGACQQIVIDPDGEFHTLREKFDYVLAGKGGDCAATVRTAPLLARRLLELGVSAIVDIYDLGADRPAFVAEFLGALMDAPRELWHPVIVVVDEAHKFCPETGKRRRKREAATMDDCTAAVISLMDSGRKRGFCGVLATQRIAKLSKDAVAEVNSKLIGRTSYPDDQQRAADELGIHSKDKRLALRDLKPGEFYAFGPAFTVDDRGDLVKRVKIGPVQTTHPEAGEAAPPPTPPRDKIRKVLGELADLPAEAEAEARTAEELRGRLNVANTRVRELEREAKSAKVETKTVEKLVIKPEQLARIEKQLGRGEKLGEVIVARIHELETWRAQLGQDLNQLRAVVGIAKQPAGIVLPTSSKVHAPASIPRRPPPAPMPSSSPATGGSLSGGERKILTVLAQYAQGRTKQQVAVLTGYSHNGGGFNNYVGALRSKGLITGGSGERLEITEDGLRELGPYTPLPTGRALFDHWCSQLGKAAREILTVLYKAWPDAVPKDFVALQAGYAAEGGGFNNALGQLRTLELIEGKAKLKSSDLLHEAS